MNTSQPTSALTKPLLHAVHLPLQATGAYTPITLDYVAGHPQLQPFYQHAPSLEGIQQAIAMRQAYPTNRALLVHALQRQYENLALHPSQQQHLQALLQPDTFTITTAHQPNIYTGPLYFLYKIIHAIKLAHYLKAQMPGYNFVPVYYMGSEDADLDELGHIFLEGEKITWQTQQSGAVGRMNTGGLTDIADRLWGQYGHLPYARQIVDWCQQAYGQHANVQEATRYLVHQLFAHYGLLVLVPDDATLKSVFTPIVQRELTGTFSAPLVASTIANLGKHYKVQAAGRPINLFYLSPQGQRERIEKEGDEYIVKALDLRFTEAEIMALAVEQPQLFSANVILRGLFQEMVLPNIVFIGGGGEIAYWLELKQVFEAAGVPYPVLLIRNSFLLVPPLQQQLQQRLALTEVDLFKTVDALLLQLAARQPNGLADTMAQQEAVNALYTLLQQQTNSIDVTLKPYVAALHTKTLQGLQNLQKKWQRAQKQKLHTEQRQLEKLKQVLFPNGSLQERTENGLPFLSQYGLSFLHLIYEATMPLQSVMGVVYLPPTLLPDDDAQVRDSK